MEYILCREIKKNTDEFLKKIKSFQKLEELIDYISSGLGKIEIRVSDLKGIRARRRFFQPSKEWKYHGIIIAKIVSMDRILELSFLKKLKEKTFKEFTKKIEVYREDKLYYLIGESIELFQFDASKISVLLIKNKEDPLIKQILEEWKRNSKYKKYVDKIDKYMILLT
jgi:hypothetical protein